MDTTPAFHAKPGTKGTHIHFPNGYVLSIQIGPGNYCDNYGVGIGDDDLPQEGWKSNTAETAILINGHFIPWQGDNVQAYQTFDQVCDTFKHVAMLAGGLPIKPEFQEFATFVELGLLSERTPD